MKILAGQEEILIISKRKKCVCVCACVADSSLHSMLKLISEGVRVSPRHDVVFCDCVVILDIGGTVIRFWLVMA